jgi:hypothetical protein
MDPRKTYWLERLQRMPLESAPRQILHNLTKFFKLIGDTVLLQMPWSRGKQQKPFGRKNLLHYGRSGRQIYQINIVLNRARIIKITLENPLYRPLRTNV